MRNLTLSLTHKLVQSWGQCGNSGYQAFLQVESVPVLGLNYGHG